MLPPQILRSPRMKRQALARKMHSAWKKNPWKMTKKAKFSTSTTMIKLSIVIGTENSRTGSLRRAQSQDRILGRITNGISTPKNSRKRGWILRIGGIDYIIFFYIFHLAQ